MAANNYLSNITYCPGDVKDLRDLIRESLWADENLRSYINLLRVSNGEKAGFIGDLIDVGLAGGGCNPEYSDGEMANSEKEWELGDWNIALKICYTAIENTIAEYTLQKGTAIGDLTPTEFMSEILRPALEKAMRVMLWRLSYFGDTNAATIANGGILTNGTDPNLFKACDGFFVKFADIITADSARLTPIASNSEATYADQKSDILGAGVATGIIDALRMDAPARLTSDPDGIILLTGRLADALSYDIKQTYKSILPWENVFEGFDIAQYDGVKVARLRIWDQMIDAYENDGTAWHNPFRAVYTTIRNLGVGTNADDIFSDFDITFDKITRYNYIYATGKIGTMVFDDQKCQFAW